MAAGDSPRSRGTRLLRLLRSRGQVERDVLDELEAHIAMRKEYLMARGYTPEDAARAARARFADYDHAARQLVEGAHQRQSQAARRTWIDELRQDLRLALRAVSRAPLFTAALIAVLAIGTGANGAVFSILRSTLLQPLPYRDPERLVMIWREYENPPPSEPGSDQPLRLYGMLTPRWVLAWREQLSPTVAELAAMVSWNGNLDAQFDLDLRDRVERLNGARVTPNFFQVLGVDAEHGRLFGQADAGGAPMVVLSHALWQRHFGGDPLVVGKAITLTGERPRQARAYTVAGVLPPEFRFSYPDETELYVLMDWSVIEAYHPDAIAYYGIARLRDGVSLEQAATRAATLGASFNPPGLQPEFRLTFVPESVNEWVLSRIRPSLLLLGGVAALLLIVTCMTVANALLARFSVRQQELAVRTALGASRSRLVRQLVTEGAVLAFIGAAAGALLTMMIQPGLRVLLPGSIPLIGQLGTDRWVVVFAIGSAVLVVMLAALGPALNASRLDGVDRIVRGVRNATATISARRLRRFILAGQAAMATTLLIVATLLLVSFWRLHQVPLGFDASRVVTLEIRLLDRKFRSDTALRLFRDELVRRVKRVPGITDAGIASAVPFRGVDFMGPVRRNAADSVSVTANLRFVDSVYFNVLRVPLLRGRLLSTRDTEQAPHVAVLSASLARQLFGDSDPIGRDIVWGDPKTVVGVVGDLRYTALEEEPRPAVYLAWGQSPSELICLVVRTSRDLASIGPELQRAVRDADPAVPAMKLTTVSEILDGTLANRRFYTVATSAFAIIGLLLTIIGLAMIVARGIAERRRELAIRASLGATESQLARWVTRDSVLAVLTGVLAGLVPALMATRFLEPFMFGVDARSAATFAGVSLGIMVVTACAAAFAARSVQRLPLSTLLSAD